MLVSLQGYKALLKRKLTRAKGKLMDYFQKLFDIDIEFVANGFTFNGDILIYLQYVHYRYARFQKDRLKTGGELITQTLYCKT